MKQFNLTILQLVLPLASMSKAEYKQVYGIDLDDIEIEKVTLVQEEGSKNKYFVDEIKATEEGFGIYAGGKILSIGDSVSVIDNAYSVENAKPIYCHPIKIANSDSETKKFRLTMLIFNNDPTPFTLATFKSFIDELSAETEGAGSILCSGGYYDGTKGVVASYIQKALAGSYYLVGMNATLTANTNIGSLDFDDIFPPASTDLVDGVNKIN